MATNAIASRDQIRRAIICVQFRLVSLVLLSFVSALAAAAATPQADTVDPPSRSFVFSYVVKVLPSAGNRRLRAWIPLPATDDFQTISQLQLQAPAGVHVHSYSGHAGRYACFTGGQSSATAAFQVRVTFHVTRYERHVDLTPPDLAPSPDPAPAADAQGPFPDGVSQFLQADKWTPLDQYTTTIAEEQTSGITDPLQKARKLFEYVVAATGHDGVGAKHSDAAKACDSRGSDCTSFNALFINLARAAGIPARLEIGFAFPDGQKIGSIPGYHCWAEFYVNGIGWIPLDASRARQEPAKRDDFFGTIDARRVMISNVFGEIPFVPAPGLSAGQFDHLVDPYIEIDGKPYSAYSADFFFQETSLDGPIPSKKKIYARNGVVKPDHSPEFPS